MDKYCFLNDRFVKEQDAKVDIFDLGFLRGYGVFDFTIAHGVKPLRLKKHLGRLENSAKILNLKLPYSLSKIAEKTLELLEKNKYTISDLRWTLTGGRDEFANRATFAILNTEFNEYPAAFYSEGIKLISADFKREIPAAKTLNYQFAFSMHEKMKSFDAFELLYTPENIVLECSTSNIFLVKNGQLITPHEDILFGITRADVIEIAKENGITVAEREVQKSELLSADEVFITASGKCIMPVIAIDDAKIGNAKPGKITKDLIKLYQCVISTS